MGIIALQLTKRVLVHMGDLHGGHYIAYIRPKLDEKW